MKNFEKNSVNCPPPPPAELDYLNRKSCALGVNALSVLFTYTNTMQKVQKKLMLLLYLICAYPLFLTAQTEPVGLESQLLVEGALNLAINFDNSFTDNESIFLVSLDYNVGSCDDINWIGATITVEIEYTLSGGGSILATKTLSLVSANEAFTSLGWYPSIFSDSFILSPDSPELCNVYSITGAQVRFVPPFTSLGCSNVGFSIYFNDELMQTVGYSFPYSFDTEIAAADYQSPLKFSIFPNIENPRPYHCGIGQTAYVAPYGGCPPYTITWLNSEGQIVNSYATELKYEYVFASVACPLPTQTYFSPDAMNVFLNPGAPGATYTVSVSDAIGNSLAQNYTFSNGIENEISFSYSISTYEENGDILLRFYLTPFSPIDGLLSFYPLNYELQMNNYTAVWFGGISNENELCDDFNYTIGNSIYYDLDQNYPAGNYDITLFNAGVSCRTVLTQEFSCEDLNLLCLNGDFFICDNTTTTLELTSAYIDLNTSFISWSNGQTDKNLIVGTSGGSYTVSVTDSNGNSTSKTFNIEIDLPPSIDFESESFQICMGEELTLTPQITGVPIGSYLWNTGHDTPNISVSPITTTTYSVTVTDTNGCTATASTTVTVNPLPVANAGANQSICIGETSTLTASGGGSYLWSTGVANATINVSPTATTTYSVTVTNTNGCTATAATTVTVFEPPQTAIEPQAGTENCTAMLTAATTNGTAPYSYTWLPLEQTTQQITAYSPGIYSVTVTDANGCTTAAAYDLPVTDLLPTPHLAGFYTVGTSPMPAGATTDPTAPNTEIWNTLNLKVAGAIIVPTGYILRIENSSIEMIGGENAEIIVKPGGKLHLSTATLYAGNCYNSFWKGISVEGSDVPYSTTDFAVAAASGNYGVLVSENDTKINHARIGACNGRITATGINRTGGLLSITHTEFKDNGTAIRIEKFNASGYQFPFIQNAAITFTQNTPPNNAPENWWHYALGQPVGIWISKTRLLEPIHNNLFASSLSVQAAGVGIRIEDAAATISALPEPASLWTDPSVTPQIYEFTGLFKGIDVYNTLTIMKEVNITNLNFQTTQKSITLNGAVGSKISYNTFTVPYGASISADTYGLLSFGSIGSIIERNKFWSEQNAPSPYTFGAILNKTEYGEVPTTLTNNLFDGRFMPATQFIDANGYLSTNCNAYDDCDIDWHLAPNASLPAQGECDLIDPNGSDLALYTHWHYVVELDIPLSYPNYHIINDNTAFTLTLNIDNSEQSDPTIIIGDVLVFPCSPNPLFKNQSCEVIFPEEGAGMADCDNEGDIERRIYNFLRNSQRDSLLALLHCLDTDWAIRLLVGTYVDERLYEQALAELQRLPNTPQNAEFIALYQAIINGGLTEPEGSGKAAAATATVSAIAQNALSANSSLAQSILAVYNHADYIRHGEPVNLPGKSLLKEPAFKLMPNPAQDQISIEFTKPIKPRQTLQIYNLQGQLVLTQNNIAQNALVNVAMLQNGMYFCRLSEEADVVKLVIVR